MAFLLIKWVSVKQFKQLRCLVTYLRQREFGGHSLLLLQTARFTTGNSNLKNSALPLKYYLIGVTSSKGRLLENSFHLKSLPKKLIRLFMWSLLPIS
jgi:hypothetical protein